MNQDDRSTAAGLALILIPGAILAIIVGLYIVISGHASIGRARAVHFDGIPARTFGAACLLTGLAILRAYWLFFRRGSLEMSDWLIQCLLWLDALAVAFTFVFIVIP